MKYPGDSRSCLVQKLGVQPYSEQQTERRISAVNFRTDFTSLEMHDKLYLSIFWNM